MQASPASPPVSSSLYHARLAPKRTDKHGEARASRDHLSVGDVALELAVMSRAGAARASIDVHAKVPSAGAGATRCAMLGPDQLSTTTMRVVALKTCAASRLFRCSLRCSRGGKRLGARPAWPLRPLHRVDDEEGRRRPPSGRQPSAACAGSCCPRPQARRPAHRRRTRLRRLRPNLGGTWPISSRSRATGPRTTRWPSGRCGAG